VIATPLGAAFAGHLPVFEPMRDTGLRQLHPKRRICCHL